MGNARLLVVEDDVDIANMLKIYFTGLQYDVDVANRGMDALEKDQACFAALDRIGYYAAGY
ncbi:MAG: hypothetical protein IPN58_02865 [Anaerolineales bacterium]|nr:hypothetical protein [Anaerolineales bacterium]